MRIPSATLAGVPLEALDTVSWVFSQGTRPYQRYFEIKKENALKLIEASKGHEVELVIESDFGNLTVKKLTVMSIGPSKHPDRLSVLVSDRRWKWKHKLIRRDLNVRRRTGEMRLEDPSHLTPSNITPAQGFAAYSMEDEAAKPWTSKTAAIDVLAEVTEGEYEAHDSDFGPVVDVDGLCLRDRGDSALERIFAFVPGLTVELDANGIAHTANRFDGSEEHELDSGLPPLEGFTLPVFVDHSTTRASAFWAYFSPIDEVRFDSVDVGAPITTSSTRILENVLPLPDTLKFVSGPRNGLMICQGTWVPIDDDLLNAWNQLAVPAITVGGVTIQAPKWDFALIRQLFLYPGGYTILFEADPENRIMQRRFDTILQHFRQTWRMPRVWADRAFEFQPTRIAIIDPVNGTRAMADVYADHAELPTMRRVAFSAGDPSLQYAVNFYAWSPNKNDPLSNNLVDGKRADSAVLVPVDPDLFIFKLVFKPLGGHLNDVLTILPGAIASKETGESQIPSADLKAQAGFFQLHASDGLSKFHRFSTVMTLSTASPQGKKGLFHVVVTPKEAASLLPPVAGGRIREASGPVHETFIGPEVMTADFAWLDEDADAIEQGILHTGSRDESRLIYPEHLAAVAKAMAARHYATRCNRWEGTKTTRFDPDRRPRGVISRVVHQLMPDGEFVTTLDMTADLQEPDWQAFVPETTRRKVFRKIQRSPQT